MRTQIVKIERYLLIFTLVDILFAPYVFFLATNYSQFIIFFWFILKDKRFFNQKEVRFYYGILSFILLSVFVSMVLLPQDKVAEYVVENLKRGLNIGLGISYYFFFYYSFKVMKVRLEKWLIAFVLYVTLWGLIYYVNTELFLYLKVLFNSRDATLSNLLNINYFQRFNFIWTDPNNIGYTLVAVVAYLIINKRVTNTQLIIVVLGLLFNLLIIMSAGSLITAILFIPLAYFIRIKNSLNFINIFAVTISILVMILFIQNYWGVFGDSDIGNKSINRFKEKNEIGDNRPDIWKKLLESKNILFYTFAGEGSVIFVENKPFSPHNGHLMFVYGYGLICYFFYMYLVFRKSYHQKWLAYVYIFPFLICFTTNIGIGELKYSAIMYMMIAISRTQIEHKRLRMISRIMKKPIALQGNETNASIL